MRSGPLEKAKAATIIARGRQVVRMQLGDAGVGLTAYPYLLILEQSRTESILNEFQKRHGKSVEWNVEVVDFYQDAEHVVATLRYAHGREEIVQTDWLYV